MDNRLDFINSFEEGAIELMTEVRKKFINLDGDLRAIMETIRVGSAEQRAFNIARTHIETALQYAIKGICLKHEKLIDGA